MGLSFPTPKPARRRRAVLAAWAVPVADGVTRPGRRPTTERFLLDLRVALSVEDRADTGSSSGGSSGTGSRSRSGGADGAPRGGIPAGGVPEGLHRVGALVELAQGGDGAAFGQLYELYVDTVYRYVYTRVGSKQTAEDLTSETFIRALRRLDSFSWQGRDIAAWFITIARNLITDDAKSARFRLEVTTADMVDADTLIDAPDTEVLDRMRDARLVEAVRGLRPQQAECIVLRFFHGLSLAETAEVLGSSEGAVKQLQLRAIRTLRREIGEEVL